MPTREPSTPKPYIKPVATCGVQAAVRFARLQQENLRLARELQCVRQQRARLAHRLSHNVEQRRLLQAEIARLLPLMRACGPMAEALREIAATGIADIPKNVLHRERTVWKIIDIADRALSLLVDGDAEAPHD